MKVETTPIPGLMVFEPRAFPDHRGCFLESWQDNRYLAQGVLPMVQDNLSRSKRGVLRGLHFTVKRPQAQFIWVSSGEVLDVAVDLRRNSPTFGKWHGVRLDGGAIRQFYLPPGFAHGFCVLSETADVHYKVTHTYDAADEFTLRWNDPDIGVEWPVADPVLKDHDARAPLLRDLAPHQLPDVDFAG